ncbi:MAG: hypothetical protein NZM35_03210 [Chitinophagales bacterium]|nr:hypothetical protein [Chitinophagales bacterium]MDW8418690.1 hypothetical protein [Chitinophagales bacterium]
MRKLFLLICIFTATSLMAQQNATESAGTPKAKPTLRIMPRPAPNLVLPEKHSSAIKTPDTTISPSENTGAMPVPSRLPESKSSGEGKIYNRNAER